jgi:hypothetical protein
MVTGTNKDPGLIKNLHCTFSDSICSCPIVSADSIVIAKWWDFTRRFLRTRVSMNIILEPVHPCSVNEVLTWEFSFVSVARSINTFGGVVAIDGMEVSRDKFRFIK